MEDIKDVEERNEDLVIIGDLNRAVGSDNWGVQANKDKVSPGGELIRNLLKTERYIMINNLDLVQGGPWTWVDRQDGSRRSCLDIGIVSVSLVAFVSSVIIDCDRKFTPRRVIRRKSGTKTIFTDHFSVMIELKGMPKKQQVINQELVWNKGNPNGWTMYERMTDEKAEVIKDIVDDLDNNIETVMNKIEKIETKIKFKAFSKTKHKSKNLVKVLNNKKTQKKDDELKQREANIVEKHIEDIKAKTHGRAGNVFRIRKSIAGPKKAGQEASSIKDPVTGELHVDRDAIKKTTLAYCVKNLQGNAPDETVKEVVKKRKIEQLKKMEDEDDTLEIDLEDFKDILLKFKKKQTQTYNFLIRAGVSYQNAIFKVCKRIIDKEEIPESFSKTTLIMIWKMKGPMNILKNNRFLHMKDVLARTVDALVVAKMKEQLVDSSSIHQVGGLPGHSVQEHILTLKTVMAVMERKKKGFLFLVIDFVSFFNREDIFDCLETLDKIQVNKKAKPLWYLLKKGTKIQVKTAHGMTKEETVGDCLGQGTAGAGLISAANLDQGLQRYFNESEEEDTEKKQ